MLFVSKKGLADQRVDRGAKGLPREYDAAEGNHTRRFMYLYVDNDDILSYFKLFYNS